MRRLAGVGKGMQFGLQGGVVEHTMSEVAFS